MLTTTIERKSPIDFHSKARGESATRAPHDGETRTAQPVAASAAADDVSTKNGSPGLRILLAKDHVVNQKLAVAMLRGMGYEPTLAVNGRRALEAWESAPFDLVLMDVQMPEMDGFEALAAIRALDDGKSAAARADHGP